MMRWTAIRRKAMTLEEVQRLIQGVFDNIFNSVTQATPGNPAAAPASSTMLSLMKPGMAIRAADFRNPWTPGNVSGSQPAAVNTAQLADIAPKMSTLWADSGNSISQIYQQILQGVSIPAQEPNPVIEKQLRDADDYLYRLVNVTDPETGEVHQEKRETLVYSDYLANQIAYNNAVALYAGAYLKAQETASGRNTWPLLASSLQLPVKMAYDKWRAGDASKVEQALAIKTTSAQNALQLAWKQAQDLFAGYGVVLEDTGGGISPKVQRCTLLPSDWYSSSSPQSGWTTYDSGSSSVALSNSSEYTKFGGSAGFSMGIFSIGGSAGHAKESKHASSETKNLRFSFDYTLVTIRRPWLTFNLLGTKGWSLGNLYVKGEISNGTKSNQQDSVMPLLPTSFVAARNIRISATWAKSDWDFIQSQMSAGGRIGIGPFSIGGSYFHSSSNETFTSSLADGNIRVPGVQIIGWISQVVPYCPAN
jgi:hypothetical protein